MLREFYTEDHEDFRAIVKAYLERDVIANIEAWDAVRKVDKRAWLAAGEAGVIGLSGPVEYGGAGVQDFRFRNVVLEEFAIAGAASLSACFALQDDIVIPYIADLGTEAQKERWLPGLCTGEIIGAIAMTEPGTGSDLNGITTTATKVEGGWRINGSKTFISSGIQADFVITVARTPSDDGRGRLSLFIVEKGAAGFAHGRSLEKIGLHGQDTAELFYDEVLVTDSDVLGEINGGFKQLVHHLPLERLAIGATSVATATAIFDQTLDYVQQRRAFGQRVADFQNTRFELAELSTEVDVARAYIDKAILALNEGTLTPVEAAKAKWWATDLENRLVSRCLQLFGGYGYMLEYPIARAYQNARVQTIFGGTNEIMKEIIGRDLVGRR